MRICSSRYPTLEDAFGNKGGSRFDDPQRIYKTLYCAPDFETCYSETLLRDQTYQPDGVYVVGMKNHFDRMLQLLVVDVAKLRLVDLMGPGRRSMGYSFSTGLGPYLQTKPLARAFYEHKDRPDGIVYMSNFADEAKPAVVLFDRASAHVRFVPGHLPIPFEALPELFDAISVRRNIILSPGS